MEQHTNIFSKGMNTDLSKTVYSKEQYLRSDNLRLVTEFGKSEFSLETIKGNVLNKVIPPTSSVVKITVDPTAMAWVGSETIELSRPALLATVFTDTWTIANLPSYSVSEIHTLLRDFINNSPTFIAAGFKAATKGEYVIVWNSDTAGTDIVVGGSFVFNFPSNVFVETLVPGLTGLRIIGRGYIRDTIVLFTTSFTSDADEPELLNSDGQIWTLDYDPTNPVQSVLTLRYNGLLNFTAARPIPSTDGSVGRFENPTIQRIYWTDNFNRPRQLNTVDTDTMALSPFSLELKAPAHFSEVIFMDLLQSGNLRTGLHNFAYRLLKTNGEASGYSPISNLIHIVGFNEETASYSSYRESAIGVNVDKSIACQINELDTSFDVIEMVNLYRNTPDDIPEIVRFLSEPIPSNGVFDFIFTGFEDNLIDVTLPEFEFTGVRFKTVKSLADKSNRLFPSNVKIDKFSIDFDARAYRWRSVNSSSYNPNTTEVVDTAGNSFTVDTTADPDTWGVPLTHDSINSDQSPSSWEKFLYQQNGTRIGGSGPHVSYEFTSTTEAVDGIPNTDIHLDSSASQGGPTEGYIRNGRTPYTYDIGHEFVYHNRDVWRNFHSPFISGLLRGYTRDEVYRFGLIFYSLDGVASDVKWVADIRMPHVYMPDLASATDTDRTLQFPYANQDTASGSTVIFGYNLGVKFTVDVSTISEQISGFSIVRVKREQEDKTILGQGLYFPAYTGSSGLVNVPWTIYSTQAFQLPYSHRYGSLNSPDFLFGAIPAHSATDQLEIIGKLFLTKVYDVLTDGAPTSSPNANLAVYGRLGDLGSAAIRMLGAYNIGGGDFYTLDMQSWDSNPNIHFDGINSILNVSGNISRSVMGGSTLFMRGAFDNFDNTVSTFTNDDGMGLGSPHKYIGNYKKAVLKQYGGNSFSERSNNVYEYCGHFQSVGSTDSSFTYSGMIVFGGDTYICMFDNVKGFKNWVGGAHAIFPDGVDVDTNGAFFAAAFPVETSLNIDLRNTNGSVVNKNFLPDTGDSLLDLGEDFVLDPLWSIENDAKKFFPKPVGAQDVEVFDHRTYVSQPKIDGELQDSWTVFPVNDYIDVEGRYGPINSTCVLNDKFYFIQDVALGLHSVNDRVLTQDLTGATLELGTGQVLQRFDYISTEVGTKHQWSVLPDASGLYLYATTLNRIYNLTGEGLVLLSAVKGIQSHLNNNYGVLINQDNPILGGGVITGKNPLYNEILFTFLSTGETGPPLADTICYNNKIQEFTGFYSFAPKIYINFNNNLFTCQVNGIAGLEQIWWHDVGLYNSFYGTVRPSKLKLLVNPFPLDTKIFDNFSYHTEVTSFSGADIPTETFNIIQSTTNYQDSGAVTLVNDVNVKRRERTWQLAAGRNNTTELERLRDKFLIVDLTYNNTSNRKFILHYFNTFFRKSYR